MTKQSIIGSKYNFLTIVADLGIKSSKNGHKDRWVKCKCICGKNKKVELSNLRAETTKSCGCKRKLKLLGQIYGNLTVIAFKGIVNRSTMWKCICKCGNKTIIRGTQLNTGRTKSCGCLSGNRLLAGEAAFRKLIRIYKYGASERKIKFNLTRDDCRILFSGNCYYCEHPPTQLIKHKHYNGNFIYNGIDRLNNKKGYSFNNCVSCCKVCNFMKNTLSVMDFFNHITQIFNTLQMRGEVHHDEVRH